MRYESLAYGTRAEILAMLENDLRANRSERRQLENARALQELQDGDYSVTVGNTTYIVEEESA